MSSKVKQLAKLSGVSVRTLHFYDEIGLLKPAYCGDNHYRFYGEAELLMLQQILFFRDLGFSLRDIQRIISCPDFDQIEALQSHRKIIEKNLDRTKNLIETVDKTIAHLRGQQSMKLEEIFQGFNAEKQKIYEDFLVTHGVNQQVIDASRNKVNTMTKEQLLENKRQGDQVHADLVKAIECKLHPSSTEVQEIVKRHYQLTMAFWTPTRDSYIGLSQLYGSHPDFIKFYDAIHPELLSFLSKAMKIFAENELT